MHNVKSVQGLYDDAMYLYKNLVLSNSSDSADKILEDLRNAINTLKTNWKGIDAGTNIGEVIVVYNAMTDIRNSLADLSHNAVEAAIYYRNIQNANRANLDTLQNFKDESINRMDIYEDTTDMIYIDTSSANKAKQLIDSVVEAFDSFTNNVQSKYNDIMNNWTKGTGRDSATQAFDSFISNAGNYKGKLDTVSQNITECINNYGS